MSKGLTTEELAKVILENQVNAVARTIFLTGKNRKVTFIDIICELALAEKKAKFVCGFEELNDSESYKDFLKKYLTEKGFVATDAEGYITLTTVGEERARVELPPPIEQQLLK